jgi:molecular chaperone HtpG
MSELKTQAEQFAKLACDLPQFRNVNLAGVKDQIAEILNMIGRVEGIFSTYTKHDISHIDTMLTMLDWLVPPITKSAMTPVDWLLIVITSYLHDLGMVVTSTEYIERKENLEFVSFLEKIKKDPEGKDYVARAYSMNPEERERFLYQEFVRLHHASRIREWVTGRHSRSWGLKVKAIADEIANIMSDLPSRFRENVALVCESHHKDDLNKIDIYPLCQRYGIHEQEVGNVQYSALLLRTIDLLHVTKDRTPSVMYKIISFSDLKSINEWDRQRDTFSVYMKGRTFNPNEPKSHIIEVSADFTEERPFFALTEYLAWADRQIKQTKQWADKSQTMLD